MFSLDFIASSRTSVDSPVISFSTSIMTKGS